MLAQPSFFDASNERSGMSAHFVFIARPSDLWWARVIVP